MNLRNNFTKAIAVVFAQCLLISSAFAVTDSPDQLVKQTTENMIAVIKKEKPNYKTNPQRFFNELDTVLSPVVAFDKIARSVMSVRHIKKATPAQLQQFEKAFKTSMIEFYGKALLKYDNQRIDVKPIPANQLSKPRVPVHMTIYAADGTTYPLTYTMFKDGAGEWKLRNVVVNGINIGKVFQSQFDQAMRENQRNIQKVIDDWSNIMKSAQEKTQAKGA
ncbi:MlaC/ttg2D family ABC transporter substrate-binding protein [Zooshikella ganghwensis]|uniref:MlaC/ttg2D family ABC transporter substrate-binding protein n=1 Tax=Zooshikella ganghwensis TaxID=202772 RepID=UPI0003F6AAAB|nr:ABC transporter substrate-binding protein [Zooshikella ganghwensis]